MQLSCRFKLFLFSFIILNFFEYSQSEELKISIDQKFDPQLRGTKNICFNRSLKTTAFGENIEYTSLMEHRKKLLIDDQLRKSKDVIPKITHHIWLTSKDKPQEVPEKDLEYIKKTLIYTPTEEGWQHIFWTNNRDIIPKTLENLSKYKIEVKEINEENLKNFKDSREIYEKSVLYNFSVSSDVLRYLILEEYGGFYFDVDYELATKLDGFLNKYSFIAHEELKKTMYIGSAFLGTTVNHPIITQANQLIRRNFSNQAPIHIRLVCHDRAFAVFGAGPAMLSVAFFQKSNSNQDYRDIFVTDNLDLYKDTGVLSHKLIGKHHGSNNWKQKDESKPYDHCEKCIKY